MCDSVDDDAETRPADHRDCTHFLSRCGGTVGWGGGEGGGGSQRRRYNQEHKHEGISVLYKVRGDRFLEKRSNQGRSGDGDIGEDSEGKTHDSKRRRERSAGSRRRRALVSGGQGSGRTHVKAVMERGHEKATRRGRRSDSTREASDQLQQSGGESGLDEQTLTDRQPATLSLAGAAFRSGLAN